jgi:hypothetical protein
MGSDGLFDNLFDDDIKNCIVKHTLLGQTNIERAADCIAVYAEFVSYKKDYVSPFTKSAIEHGFDISLYEKGNSNIVIGDYGTTAKDLYDKESWLKRHAILLIGIAFFLIMSIMFLLSGSINAEPVPLLQPQVYEVPNPYPLPSM